MNRRTPKASWSAAIHRRFVFGHTWGATRPRTAALLHARNPLPPPPCREIIPLRADLLAPLTRAEVSPMIRPHRVTCLVVVLLALAPAGARLLWWQKGHSLPVDASMAQAGEFLFKHDWKPADPMSPQGDGLGPVFNARSCVACHHQAGPGGGGGLQHNVTTFTVRAPGQPPREGVVHAFSTGRRETLQDVHSTLPPVSQPTLEQVVVVQGRSNHCLPFPSGVHISQRNTPALFGAHLIDEIPERAILAGAKAQRLRWGMASADTEGVPVGRASRLANGRVGRFGW